MRFADTPPLLALFAAISMPPCFAFTLLRITQHATARFDALMRERAIR